MGIRVHKRVGWGIDNFNTPEDFHDRYEELAELSTKEFIAWVISNQDEIIALVPDTTAMHNIAFGIKYLKSFVGESSRLKRLDDPHLCVGWDDEFGLEKAIIIHPLHMKNCRRYDDLIDWLEESNGERWKYLKKGIHPYNKGVVPVSVVATCLFLGIENIIPNLREALYVYWS